MILQVLPLLIGDSFAQFLVRQNRVVHLPPLLYRPLGALEFGKSMCIHRYGGAYVRSLAEEGASTFCAPFEMTVL